MKKLILLLVMLSIATVTFAGSTVSTKGTYITSGAVVYNYLNQNTRNYASNQQENIPGIYITSDTKIIKFLSEDKTMGFLQVEIKLNNGDPIIVWVRTIDIK